MAKKRGGQPKPVGEQKSANVQIRMSEAENAAFAQAAQLHGLTKSAWIRMRLREAAGRDLGEHGIKPQFLPKTLGGERGNRTQRA